MLIPEVNEFLDSVCSEIKYKSARSKVKDELMNHIDDHASRLISMGYDHDEAYKRAVTAMGESSKIGKALNKEHKPYLGWLVKFTNILVGLGLVYFGSIIFTVVLSSLTLMNYEDRVNKEDISYEIELDGFEYIEYKSIEPLKLIRLKNNDLIVYYKVTSKNPIYGAEHTKSFSIYDEDGNSFRKSSVSSTNTFYKSIVEIRVSDVPSDMNMIYMEYDWYNHYVRFDIDLSESKVQEVQSVDEN